MNPVFIINVSNDLYDGQVGFYNAIWSDYGSTSHGMDHASSFTHKGLKAFVLSATRGENDLKAEWHGAELREGEASSKSTESYDDTVDLPDTDHYGNLTGYTSPLDVIKKKTIRYPITQDTILDFISPDTSCKFLVQGLIFKGIIDGKEVYDDVFTSTDEHSDSDYHSDYHSDDDGLARCQTYVPEDFD